MRAALFALVLVSGCENRQAFQEPDWTLARMLEQRRADPYEPSTAFADGKTMREPPRGSVPRGSDLPPPPITRELLATGRVRFERLCGACHGVLGDGTSVVATKMTRRPPPSLHEDRLRALTRAQLYKAVTEGYGLMPSYSEILGSDDRWAVVAYVKALQLSQHAQVASLPPDVRGELAKVSP